MVIAGSERFVLTEIFYFIFYHYLGIFSKRQNDDIFHIFLENRL